MEDKENKGDFSTKNKIGDTSDIEKSSINGNPDYIKSSTNNDMDKLADLFANLIEKYADKMDLDTLPDPERPT